jgi:hypothetical protein
MGRTDRVRLCLHQQRLRRRLQTCDHAVRLDDRASDVHHCGAMGNPWGLHQCLRRRRLRRHLQANDHAMRFRDPGTNLHCEWSMGRSERMSQRMCGHCLWRRVHSWGDSVLR